MSERDYQNLSKVIRRGVDGSVYEAPAITVLAELTSYTVSVRV
jgi:hypothetical protein